MGECNTYDGLVRHGIDNLVDNLNNVLGPKLDLLEVVGIFIHTREPHFAWLFKAWQASLFGRASIIDIVRGTLRNLLEDFLANQGSRGIKVLM